MTRIFKFLFFIVLGILAILIIAAAYIHFKGIPKYDPPKIADISLSCDSIKTEEGARIAAMICKNCHLGKDGKLSGGLMKDLDPAFGTAYIANITQHPEYGIGSWTNSELAYLLRTGIKRDGIYAPPWMPKFPHLSDQDMEAILCYLRSDHPQVQASEATHPASAPSFLAKFLVNTVMKPLPYPEKAITAPDTSDKVAYGRYVLHSKVECYTCHSADFKDQDPMVPENSLGYLGGGNILIDLDGKQIYSANLTMDKKTGLGNWAYEDFYKAVKEGKRPDGKLLRYPMVPYSALSDLEVESIWAYLQTVPKIENEVNRTGL